MGWTTNNPDPSIDQTSVGLSQIVAADGDVIIGTAVADRFTTAPSKAYGRSLWNAVDQTAARSLLGVVAAAASLLVANNLSDLTSAPTALTNLGGTTVGKAVFIAANAAAARTAIGAVINTDVQAYNANLTTWQGKTAPAGTVIGDTDAQALTNKTFNAASNTLSNIATSMFAANVVDTDATLAANSNTRLPSQAAVKSYVDNAITGIFWKPAVLVATTANITLSGEQTIDGILTSASRVLVKNQTTATGNGIYLSASGAWTRVTDADSASELWGATVYVERGTAGAGGQWTNSNTSLPTLGSTNITFSQIAGAGTYSATGGITLTGNSFALTSASNAAYLNAVTAAADKLAYFSGSGAMATTDFTSVARTLVNQTTQALMRSTGLGLGTSAVIDTGTSGTKVALLDGANTWSAANLFSAAVTHTVNNASAAQNVRLTNSSGPVYLSLDPGANGFNSRDALIKASNNGSNVITLDFLVANGATPTSVLTLSPSAATFAVRPTFNGNTPYDSGNLPGTDTAHTVKQTMSHSVAGTSFTYNGPAGTGGGAGIGGKTAGTTDWAIGSYSSVITGGTYDRDLVLYSAAGAGVFVYDGGKRQLAHANQTMTWLQQHTFNAMPIFPVGFRMLAVLATDISNKLSTINTTNKSQGYAVWDANNTRIMVASGSSATDAWWSAGGGTSVTPA